MMKHLLEVSTGEKVARIAAAILLLFFSGCSSNEPAKTSLFEDDHVAAAHWPTDLQDLSSKLRERVAKLDSTADKAVRKELEDLVGWTAEIAADTNLSEADWMPIYGKSEAIAANLRAAGGSLSAADQTQIETLCKLIDESISKIPAVLPDLKAKDL